MSARLPLDSHAIRRAQAAAAEQGGVLSRPQIYACGVPRWLVRREVVMGRWVALDRQSIAVHNGPLEPRGWWWAAVFAGGPRAVLDGASALVAHGLQRYDVARVRVSIPRGARVRRSSRFDIRHTRRLVADDRWPGGGVPRTKPEIAALRGAWWARTDKEATYLVTVAVQQGLTRPEDLGRALLRVRRDKRRSLLHELVNDLLGGAGSMGELDVLRLLRRRGLPEPVRQQLRRDSSGRYYLDLYWPDYRLVVEVDGIHHAWAENIVGDALRQNTLTLHGDAVLRIPLLGLRLQPERFLDQVEAGLRAGGYRHAA
ncbi:endonuclease domain-containing protein [Nocardioides acrostichi]|uniref:DUF559 domain-containing protein n=1 Tax=Nocardioides acrostichi TaxID=2784339 RepID=A0A930UVP5_9ACTN|nr:DUF559 domain-containing protein [Nocardioides acrostichi]MBF4160497.1 DUF559 domain-containing protein [Nocardioides acrostichi]